LDEVRSGSGQFILSALGSGIGNASVISGGTINISSAHDINVDPNYLAFNGTGSPNTNGGQLTLNGSANTALINVSSSLAADATGSGNAGSISLTGPQITVNGNITANAINGNAGTISITPSVDTIVIGQTAGTGYGYISGNLSANSQTGNGGNITFGGTYVDAQIYGSLSATGGAAAANGSVNFLTGSGEVLATIYSGSQLSSLNLSGSNINIQGADMSINSITGGPNAQVSLTSTGTVTVNGVVSGTTLSLTANTIIENPGSSINAITSLSIIANTATLPGQNSFPLLIFQGNGNPVSLSVAGTQTYAVQDGSAFAGTVNLSSPSEINFQKVVDPYTAVGVSVGAITLSSPIVDVGDTLHSSSTITVQGYGTSGLAANGNFAAYKSVNFIPGSAGQLTLAPSEITIDGNASLEIDNYSNVVSSGSLSFSSLSANNKSTLVMQAGGSLQINGAIDTYYVNGANTSLEINAPGSVSVVAVPNGSNAAVGSNGDIVVTAGSIINPNAFTAAGRVTFNLLNGTTIANPNGGIALSSNMVINVPGRSLALIASGDITETGVPLINLSSGSSDGGNLTVLAGVSISTQATDFGKEDNSSIFYVTGASASGGSINLLGSNIITSSSSTKAGFNDGGSVIMLANVGTASAGVITTGSINASSSYGNGGNITLIAPGGITVNGSIFANSSSGGGNVFLSGSSATLSPLEIVAGHMLSSTDPGVPSAITPSNPQAGSGAAVVVNGAISVLGSTFNALATVTGGSVTVNTDAQIQVGGAISTGGPTTSGAVSLSSLSSSISVAGNINTSGLTAPLSEINIAGMQIYLNGGTAGAVTINAPGTINIKGSLIANGGNGYGGGGQGGNVTIATSSSNSIYYGDVSISGYINTSGGLGSFVKCCGAPGGPGGTVNITAGELQILGVLASPLGSASIYTAGGYSSQNPRSTAGSVSLTTYAEQQLPSNFDLSSSKLSEYALPGGLLQIGSVGGVVVNGTASNIITNSAVKASDGFTDFVDNGSSTSPTGFTIAALGGGQNLNVAGQFSFITPGSSTARTKVTPAEALALFQLSRAQVQTVGLNSQGQLALQDPSNLESTITVQESDIPSSFTAFNLAAQGNKIQLVVNGSSPVINLSSLSSANINGDITFGTATGTAMINTGAFPLSIASGVVINANQLLISSGAIKNSGSITAGQVIAMDPGAAFSLVDSSTTGSVAANALVLPTVGTPQSVTITDSAGQMNAPVTYSTVLLASAFGPVVSKTLAGTLPAARVPFPSASAAQGLSWTVS